MSAMQMNGKLAWVLQECPCVVLGIWCIFRGACSAAVAFVGHACAHACAAMAASAGGVIEHVANRILIGLFLLHYTQRCERIDCPLCSRAHRVCVCVCMRSTFIFPLLIRGGKPTPFVVFLMALLFCVVNGYLQMRFLTEYAVFPANWTQDPRFLVGVAVFFLGMGINIHSDGVLRNLRKPGTTGYFIPNGGLFEFVSGANFFGEILEWAGFAIASWSLIPLSFALFTFCNIGPRGAQHHEWYLKTFGDKYPRHRRAVIPFVW